MFNLGIPIERVNYLTGHKRTAISERYGYNNKERCGVTVEVLDEVGKTSASVLRNLFDHLVDSESTK